MPRRRVLTQAEIDHILGSGLLRITDAVSWSASAGRIRALVTVEGLPTGVEAVIDLGISIELPGKYTFNLRLSGGQVLRRLDVRGSHTNRPPCAPEHWRQRSHKHTYRDDVDAAGAYTPPDIPFGTTDNPGSVAAPDHADEYREAFDAFCQECGIENVGAWTDPDPVRRAARARTLGEVA